MEGQHIQQTVPMSVPLEHEGAGDTSVIATVSEASLEWDAYADGGYDLLRENNSHGSAWMQFPNIHRMQPANCGNYSSVSPFSTTWIEHTSKIWKSSYPYTFYRTSFDDDFEDYKSCESEDDFYSCDSNESDVEEFQINFRETSQVNINIDTLTIQLKFTVSSVSLTQTNKTRSQAKITETTNFKDNNVFPQENAEMSAGKCSYYDEIRLNEATYHAPASDSQLFTEYAEFDEQMNDNDDKELKPLVQPTSFHSNHAIKRLLDPFENAANVYNNYQLVSISPSGSDPDIDEPHFIVLCPNSNGNFVEDGEFILNEEYYDDSYIENTTNTSYQLTEKILESDSSFFGLSATSAVEKTPMHKHIRSNESGIDYLECCKMDITNQSEIIGDNDLLLEKDFPSMKIKFVDSMDSVIAYGITNASDVTKDALQTPDDMTDEDEGKTKDDETMLCNLKDDYVNRTLSPVSSQRPSSDESACSSDTIHCDEVNSISSMEDTELQDQLLTKPLEWKYNPIFIPKNEMNRDIENEASVGGMLMNAYPDVLTNNGSGGQNSLYKIVTENNQHKIVFPHSTDQKERNTADVGFRKLPEKLEVNEESLSSSYKEKTTITSDQSSENEFESDNSFFSLSACSSVENTQMHENGRSNEFTNNYQECSKIHISDQSEIIGDNDLLPEKDPSSIEMKFVDSMKSIVGYGITNASDMTKDALQTPDDMTVEDEGKTKDDEKMLCNLKDDYVNRTLSSISSPRPSSDESACSSDTIHCDEINSISSMEDTELQDQLLTKPLEWKYNPIFIPKNEMNREVENEASVGGMLMNGSGGQNSLYKIVTEDNEHIIVSPHSTDQKERNTADTSLRKLPEEFEVNEESLPSSHKEKTTITSDQSLENEFESDSNFFSSSASSSVENTQMHEKGRSNELTIDYPEYSKMDITDQSEIIGDNDLLPEKEFPSMKMKFVDNMKSIVSHGITNASDMTQDTLQMPDDLSDEDEGKTKDEEKMLCNLIDDYVNRTILSIRDELYREVKDIETGYHHMQYKQPSNNEQTSILEEILPKQLNVEIPSPESKSNTLETNNSLKHDKIAHQLYVEEESLYHKHDTENKPYEAFNVFLSRTETTVKRKVMSESYVENTYSGEDEESDALRYKNHPSDYLDFEKGFVSSSPRPSSDGSACSSDIIQCDEVNSIRSMEDTELQDQLLTKPLEWNYNPIYPKKAMNSRIEKQASFEMIYPDELTNNGSGGQNSLYKIDTENNQHIIVSPHSTDQNERNSADISFRKIPEELDENEESSSSSHKEKTTSTSDQSSESVSESDNSLFTSSASSSVENTPVQENGRSNEFTIDYPEYSTSDISYQSEIISDNDLLPEKDYSTMKINSAYSVESVVAHGITNASDMRQDTLQMPDDLTDEDEGKTKDDEKILCNLIDDYVTRTILSIRDELYREVKDIETGYHHMQYKQPSNNKQTSILEEILPKQLNVKIPSPESKSNTLETNNSLKHEKISHQLSVKEESLYHKHDTENKPYEAFNVLLNVTETTVKPKVMSESYVDDTYNGEDEESDALRYKDHPSDYLDFEKGFVSSSPRPSSDGSACSTDIIQCDEVNSIRSMENTELQDQLLTKPSEWKYIPMYIPKKEMKNKTEKESSFDQECTQSINGIECHLEFNPDTVKFDKNYTQISNQEDETNPNRIGVKYIDRKEYKIELANDGDTIRLDKECKHAIEQERKHGMNGTDLVLYLDPMRFDQKCKHTAEVEPHRSFNDITPVDRSYADWHDTKTDTASTKPLESKFNPTYIPKNALNFSKMSDNSLSKIPVYERCNSPTGSSSVSSSNIGIKVADLAKNFSSSQFDTRNSIRRNRNYCEDLDVSVAEISKTFDDSSDINTSQVRQMPKRQKGKQMEWKLNPIYIPQKAISNQIEKEATFDSMASNAYDVLTNNSSGAQNRIMDDASLDNLVPGVAASKTCIYSGNNSINGDPSFDNLVMKCDPDCTKLQKADKRATIKNTPNVSKTSDNNLSKIPVYESCSSRTGSSNTGVKVADLAKMFSSSKLDIMNSMRRNRNACKELNVSVSEILKTFIDSSDINTSNVRQMPVRQKGQQMVSTSPDRVNKGRIHVQDERNVANKNQDAIVENVSNKHDELNVESKGNEVENSSFQSLNTDVDSIYTRYTSKDDKGYLATFLKRKHYSPVKLKYLHESKPVKIDHSKLRTIIKSLDQPQRPYSEEIEKRQMFSEADPNQTCTSDHPANVEESQKNLLSENKRCTRRANKSDDDEDDDDDDDADDDDDDEFSRFEY